MPRSIGNVVVPSSRPPTYTTFTSGSGTYTAPAGCSYLIVEMCGGGGGGGYSTGASGGGGSGAGYIKVRFTPGTYSYAVGAGAASLNTAGFDGNNGVNTTFSTLIAARGIAGSGLAGGAGGASQTNTTTGALAVILDIQGGKGGGSSNAQMVGAGGTSYWATICPPFPNPQTIAQSLPRGYGGGGAGSNNVNFTEAGGGGSGRIAISEFY